VKTKEEYNELPSSAPANKQEEENDLMNDSRFQLQGTFTIYGKIFPVDMNLNWCAQDGQIDRRIFDFFNESHDEAWNECEGMSTKKPIAVKCGHTKKCGWTGTEDDFVYIETKHDKRTMDLHGIRSRTGSCPKCGGIEFYYPKSTTPTT
jgi:predicted nucleic-acid-binding Zn-ribbon protein